jgi:thioredoxin 1
MTKKHVVEVNDLNFSSEVLSNEGTVLIDFSAQWCAPCKVVAPLVEKIARERAGTVKVAKIDIEDSPGAATQLAIRGAPTFVVFRNGKEVRRHTGVLAERGLVALLEGA